MRKATEPCAICGGRIGPERYGNGLACYGCGPVEAVPLDAPEHEDRKLENGVAFRSGEPKWHGWRLIKFEIPIRTPSSANLREHYMARARRAKKQKADTSLLCPRWTWPPILLIRLTRIGGHELDSHDNLPAALKPVVDGIASWLRIDDASPLVKWEYRQEKGEPSVLVQILTRQEGV
jgi:hypothetical protein